MKVDRGAVAAQENPVGQEQFAPAEATRAAAPERSSQTKARPAEGRGRAVPRARAGEQPAARQEAEILAAALLADPEVHAIGDLLDREEFRSGAELRDELQVFQDRYDQAVRADDVTVLSRLCRETNSRWGHVCVLAIGHEERVPHWGTTPEGPAAWLHETHGSD
ncbi:hypothetical protein ACWGA4_12150 [Streptomyces rubiginosohelvolus]|uniref:hypothetical protein n=1 Tax=Streptomyces sp. CB02130 TaxID=1703934 RepID=UPI0009A0C50E|nr:hypothetical protein [Streptomyces sp. CB02130]